MCADAVTCKPEREQGERRGKVTDSVIVIITLTEVVVYTSLTIIDFEALSILLHIIVNRNFVQKDKLLKSVQRRIYHWGRLFFEYKLLSVDYDWKVCCTDFGLFGSC